MLRKCVTTLRLRSDRFTVCRARLAADFVLAIGNNQESGGRARSRADCDCQPRSSSRLRLTHSQIQMLHLCHVQAPEYYNRLFNSSFVFCRWAARAPRIRICSTESVAPDAGVEIVWSWLCGFTLAATKVLVGCDRGAFVTFGKRSGVICTSAPTGTRS